MGGTNRQLIAGIAEVTDRLVEHLCRMHFSEPVTHVYNPLIYARSGYDRYMQRFGGTTKSIVMVGMNPGPFGMAQTGVPFGDVQMVTEWMAIHTQIGQPTKAHPKRPITGFACPRGEVSGRRLWDWARQRFGSPEAFFKQIIVLNYCPLVFMEASGRNRTPDRLPAKERKALFRICDQALRESVEIYQPQRVLGVGRFAEKRIREALGDLDLAFGRITHPSPANPKANRGWAALIESELMSMGIKLP
jgi:single-strand selective monofunctional uracil DNA glycosylase